MNCNELKAARVRRGIAQKALADALGLSQVQYSRIENGKCNATLARAEQIINVLSLSQAEKKAIFF